jgi:hypothetical protein
MIISWRLGALAVNYKHMKCFPKGLFNQFLFLDLRIIILRNESIIGISG